MEALNDFSANLTYAVSHPGTRTFQRSGSVKFQPEDKFIILFEREEIYCDGNTIWVYEKGEESSVIIRDFEPEEDLNLEVLFELYRAKADPRYDGTERVHGVDCHKIFLDIKDPKLDYDQAYIWINTENELAEKVVLIDRRQTRTTFEFSNIKTNTGMTANDFRFEVPANTEIIDERE